MPEVRVAVLGDLEVWVDDRVVTVTRPRLRALLCALGSFETFDVLDGQAPLAVSAALAVLGASTC
ncbi:hypothetical protein ACFQ1S_26725 [Kibdelosporangium lantanae]|uniref:STAS domain-containing protein n=1 Tax=Kibdelosporangium lantanae TaxID=1497396 RepID=A0ABW3ME59_9PSEU